MSTDSIIQDCLLPNPLTPLAFIEPGIASQLANGTYLHSGILAVLIWDDLHNLRKDYLLLTKYRIGPATVAYFAAKLTALGYCLGRAFIITHPVEHCKTLELAIDSLLTVFVSLDSILFYIRVCAMYYNKLSLVIVFGLCCLATIATACLLPVSITAMHIGPTKYCVQLVTRSLLPTYLAFLAFDTLVFLATAYRLYSLYNQEETSFQRGIQVAFLGRSMPAFSKTLLHESQLYYLVVSLAKVPTVFGSIFIKSQAGEVAIVNLVVVHAILGNILTCRVYRNTRLGLIKDSIEYDSFSQSGSSNGRTNAFPRPFPGFSASGGSTARDGVVDSSSGSTGHKAMNLVDIRKETTTITVVDYPSAIDRSTLQLSTNPPNAKA
ncbi:hypothetical protein NLJ89_g6306 [Agrocybe chaxingu]|uniref:Uncharacterized protein n=1 Tax=Agrocybe chaxingu TaxID=84603 RepID=A0A9W8MUS1_9AGAR|nr:hypothetical protein NLJ89_g6306 [Agrocybe chaxingu]